MREVVLKVVEQPVLSATAAESGAARAQLSWIIVYNALYVVRSL